ncbi:MAG: hypothetical protein Q4F38_07225, partial [Akkermansia sp.]|nr:hypothetical protein [Akkermansia sp.]
ALSGCPVSGCRKVYMKHRDTSSLFLKNFQKFFSQFSKTLKNQQNKKSFSGAFLSTSEKTAKINERIEPLQKKFCKSPIQGEGNKGKGLFHQRDSKPPPIVHDKGFTLARLCPDTPRRRELER